MHIRVRIILVKIEQIRTLVVPFPNGVEYFIYLKYY